jgi:hypothetical protein
MNQVNEPFHIASIERFAEVLDVDLTPRQIKAVYAIFKAKLRVNPEALAKAVKNLKT